MRKGPAVGPGAVVRAILLAAIASLGALSGCREAPISFAAVPPPALSDDLGLAERRAGRELTVAEYEGFIAVHDAYLEAWRETIRGEAEPIAREVRGVDPEELRKDAVRIRNLVERQQAVLGRLARLDRDLAGAIAGLGPGTVPIAEAFVARRSLDRANAILETDGDAALADLRDTAERILGTPEFDDLRPETVAAIDAILDRHDGLAAPLRERVGEAAIELTLDWRSLEDASPPADSLIDPSIEGDARVDARNRIAFERLAEARGRLATALTRLAELDDATLVALDGADRRFAESVGHAVLRQRVRDTGIGIRIRRMAFLARVASQVPELDEATRGRLARGRERFLARDIRQLRDLLVILREGLVPGVFEPGGPGAGGRRLERIRRIENERERSLAEFRTFLERLVPAELLDSLDSLIDLDPAEFRVALSRITGEDRSGRLAWDVADDLLNPQPRESPSGDSGVEDNGPDGDRPREAAVFMGRPIAPGDLSRLAARCGIEGPVPQAWIDVAVADAERRRPIEKEEGEAFERDLRRAVSAVMDGDSAERASESIRAVFATVDRIRARQVEDDAALIDALVASGGPPIPPVEAAFWKLERSESSGRVRWSQIPGVDGLALPREARVDPGLLVGSLDLPRPARALLLELVAEYGDRVAAEDFRRAAIEAVRRMFTTAIEAQVAGRRIDDDEPGWRAELGRMRASAVAEAGRTVAIRRAILDRIARSLSRGDARRLHEAHFAAAYPGILDLRDPLALALEELRGDTALDDRAYPAILVALDQRDEARDRALAGLREWTATEAADRVDGRIRGTDFRKTDPRCAFLLTLRREADVRAVRRIRVLLDEPARVRHPLVAESPRPPYRPLDRIRVYE